MLYLVGDPADSNSTKYFFANPIKRVASSQWAFAIKSAIGRYEEALRFKNSTYHSVLKWIDSGCPSRHSGYLLVAIFESDDLTQDFEAGITNFRENHPEYFI